MNHRLAFALALAAGAAPSLACSNNAPIYFPGPTPLLELTGQEMTPRITNGVQLKFRAPTDDEKKALTDREAALKAADPMHRDIKVPWISRDKIHLELIFTVTNLDTEAGTFDVTVDGASENAKYDEDVVAMALQQGNNDQPTYLPLLSLHPQLPASLGPGATYQGTFREDDFDEAEADLDALDRWAPADPMAAPPFPAVLLNRQDVDPVGTSGVPAQVVTPALVEVDVTLTASKHMQCEWLVRVRDDDDRLWHDTADPHFNPKPKLFQPMIAATP
ncbi:MAG TPA: hypothetical protein VHL80_01135 [Polyangia bacterium]|nr:hypothetical protein [Polyangia bacterium]